jgi:hypothetical protein
LQYPCQRNRDYLNNGRQETSKTFRNNKREYMKEKVNEIETKSKNKNIRDLYRGKNEFKEVTNLEKTLKGKN